MGCLCLPLLVDLAKDHAVLLFTIVDFLELSGGNHAALFHHSAAGDILFKIACRHRLLAHIEECLDARPQCFCGVAVAPMVGVDQIA